MGMRALESAVGKIGKWKGVIRGLRREVNLKCRTSNTMIVCACHYTPMSYEPQEVKRWRTMWEPNKQGNFALCDVCRHIDLMWATEIRQLTGEWLGKVRARSDPFHIEAPQDPIPLVAKAIRTILLDYNSVPSKYHSICERKLKLTRESGE